MPLHGAFLFDTERADDPRASQRKQTAGEERRAAKARSPSGNPADQLRQSHAVSGRPEPKLSPAPGRRASTAFGVIRAPQFRQGGSLEMIRLAATMLS